MISSLEKKPENGGKPAIAMVPTIMVAKVVFNLFVIDGFSHQEISEKLGISIGTSKSNLSKAKGNLKNILINKIEALQQK